MAGLRLPASNRTPNLFGGLRTSSREISLPPWPVALADRAVWALPVPPPGIPMECEARKAGTLKAPGGSWARAQASVAGRTGKDMPEGHVAAALMPEEGRANPFPAPQNRSPPRSRDTPVPRLPGKGRGTGSGGGAWAEPGPSTALCARHSPRPPCTS